MRRNRAGELLTAIVIFSTSACLRASSNADFSKGNRPDRPLQFGSTLSITTSTVHLENTTVAVVTRNDFVPDSFELQCGFKWQFNRTHFVPFDAMASISDDEVFSLCTYFHRGFLIPTHALFEKLIEKIGSALPQEYTEMILERSLGIEFKPSVLEMPDRKLTITFVAVVIECCQHPQKGRSLSISKFTYLRDKSLRLIARTNLMHLDRIDYRQSSAVRNRQELKELLESVDRNFFIENARDCLKVELPLLAPLMSVGFVNHSR